MVGDAVLSVSTLETLGVLIMVIHRVFVVQEVIGSVELAVTVQVISRRLLIKQRGLLTGFVPLTSLFAVPKTLPSILHPKLLMSLFLLELSVHMSLFQILKLDQQIS